MDAYYETVARLAERGGMVVALGGLDTGKTTFCRDVAEVAVRRGHTVAYLDTDVGQSTVGPPASIGLKFVDSQEDLEPERLARADALYFVGSATPKDHLLPVVVGAVKLADEARKKEPHIVVVDTTGFIAGMQAQVLKYHKVEALRPDAVIGFQRGGELEPILGAIRRALPADVEALPVDQRIVPTSVDQRAEHRRAWMRAAFEPPLHRWKVKPSVFVPAIPPDLDLALLDGVLVGMEDGKGTCIGLGILEYRDDSLRMISTLAEGAKALLLGSVKVTPEFSTVPVDLRDIFLTD